MKLTTSDKQHLVSLGHPAKDIPQIEEAAGVTTYELDGRRISRDDAMRRLGRKAWLSGIGRSSFHWSASVTDRYGKQILFNSRKLFN